MLLVLGIGNPLREDDGAGPAVAARLGPPALAVHQLAPELAEPVSRAACVVFVDAARDVPPGDVAWRRVTADDGALAPFTHQATPAGVLAVARTLYGATPEAWVVRLGGTRFGYGETLSPAVEAAVDGLVARLRMLRDTCASARHAFVPGG